MPNARIIGIADTAVGKLPGTTTLELTTQAAVGALSDAGLELSAVDGIITSNPMVGAFPRHALAVAEHLGVIRQLTHCETTMLGGASPLAGVVRAAELVRAGTCEAVLVVAADTPRTGQDRGKSVAAFSAMRHPDWEVPFGVLNASAYALLADAYLGRYGLGADHLAPLPVAQRRHAMTNPAAVYRTPLSTDDVIQSRMVSSPLRLLECSPISDGGGAVVVAAAGRQTSGRRRVEVRGAAVGFEYDHVAYAGDLTRTGCYTSSRRALEQARLCLDDIDVALLYDSYSITLAIELEEIGLCPPGHAGAFVADGGIAVDGPVPVNTHGGLLSHAHCGGAAGIHHITEAVRQLSASATNQISGAEIALVHAEGGILSANCTALLAAAP